MSREHISYMQRIDDARIRRERQHAKLFPMQISAMFGKLEKRLERSQENRSAISAFFRSIRFMRPSARTRNYNALVRLGEMYRNDGDGESVLAIRARESLHRANNGVTRNVTGLFTKPAEAPKVK